MIKMKQKNDSNVLLANTKGQPLKEHSLAVALYGYLLLKSLKFKPNIEIEMNQCLMYSALLHDIGKVSKSFQEYIKKHIDKERGFEEIPTDAESLRRSFIGPFHNEISWAYSINFICFRNQDIRKIICHSVYWHHPANWNDKSNKLHFENAEQIFENVQDKLEEDKDQLLKDMYNFTRGLFQSFALYYRDNLNLHNLKKPEQSQIREIQHPKFFDHKLDKIGMNAKKQLCLNLLLESDRSVSSWTPDELNNFLNEIQKSDKKISDWNFLETESFLNKWKRQSQTNKNEKISILKDLRSNTRSKEQFNLSKKMSNKRLSVCGVDPAGGKTSIALYWWNRSNNKCPLMIALPRQHQVTGLFQSLETDRKRIFGSVADIKMEGVFNGTRQMANWTPPENADLMISDINIMVFDRFLSPYYKRSQSSEFIKMLSSDLVLDEFHEFKNIPKMIPSLKEILTIRSWLDSDIKTLMLSGTPEPPLLKLLNIEKSDIFERTELSSRENHKFKLFIEEKTKIEKKTFFRDCLYSFLRVEVCQEAFALLYKKHQDKINLIHSYFISKDKKVNLEGILKEHGSTDSFLSEKSVVTAKMLQSSYNLSFEKAILELSQPDTDCQTAGRINRFANKLNPEMHFFYDEQTEKFFDKRWGSDFKEVHLSWKTHLQNFINRNKGRLLSMRKFMECYDNFWTEENINKALKTLNEQQEDAIQELNKYIPKRFVHGGKNKKSSSSLNSLFRGESLLLSACVVDDKGNAIDQLQGEDLLSEGRTWLIQKIKEIMKYCLKTEPSCKKANKIKEDVFDYNKHIMKYNSFGYRADRPLLCSHFNTDINQCFQNQLLDTDTGKTYHQVYNRRFGLVKQSLLEDNE